MELLRTPSDTDLVPEEYQMRLLYLRDEFTRGYFEIGDIANELVMMNIHKGLRIEQAAIYNAVGRFSGKSGRTIRDYAEVAAFFPKELRDQYEMLPFSHFRFAKSCGREWETVLQFSMLNPGASEDRLAHEFLSGGVAASLDAAVAAKEQAVAACLSDAVAAGVAPDVAASVAASVAAGVSEIYHLANLISLSEKLLSWEMKKETRRKLTLALDGLKDVLSELSQEVKASQYETADKCV